LPVSALRGPSVRLVDSSLMAFSPRRLSPKDELRVREQHLDASENGRLSVPKNARSTSGWQPRRRVLGLRLRSVRGSIAGGAATTAG
jgi:hypothetical protein